MTNIEFAGLIKYVKALAPKTALNETQIELWRKTFDGLPEPVVRNAIDAACAASPYECLRLGQVTKVLKDRRGDRGPGTDRTAERIAAERDEADRATQSWESVAACINGCSDEHLATYKALAIENHATAEMFRKVWPNLDPRLDCPATKALRGCIANLIRGKSCWPEPEPLTAADFELNKADLTAHVQRCEHVYGDHSRSTWLARKRLAELCGEAFEVPDPVADVPPGNIGTAIGAMT